MKILAQRPTHISAVATVLLIHSQILYIYIERDGIYQHQNLDSRPESGLHGDETWREDFFGHEGSIIR